MVGVNVMGVEQVDFFNTHGLDSTVVTIRGLADLRKRRS